VSNFIVLERYAENRSAESWTAALSGLPVQVIQATSDEAKGLCRHVQTDLGAQHAPDLFHLQHEVAKATGLPLARQVKAAEQALADAQARVEQQYQARTAYESQRPPGRPPAFEQRLAQAHQQVAVAERDLQHAQAHQTQAQEVLHELSAAYHPYDLDTGQAQPSERVAGRLQGCWQTLNQLARAANLPERCQQQIRKAQRLTGSLLATLSFFFATVQAKIEALNLLPEVETAVYHSLDPRDLSGAGSRQNRRGRPAPDLASACGEPDRAIEPAGQRPGATP
jgi:aminopeptidase N